MISEITLKHLKILIRELDHSIRMWNNEFTDLPEYQQMIKEKDYFSKIVNKNESNK